MKPNTPARQMEMNVGLRRREKSNIFLSTSRAGLHLLPFVTALGMSVTLLTYVLMSGLALNSARLVTLPPYKTSALYKGRASGNSSSPAPAIVESSASSTLVLFELADDMAGDSVSVISNMVSLWKRKSLKLLGDAWWRTCCRLHVNYDDRLKQAQQILIIKNNANLKKNNYSIWVKSWFKYTNQMQFTFFFLLAFSGL